MSVLIAGSALIAASEINDVPISWFQRRIELNNINRLTHQHIAFHSYHMLDADDKWLSGSNYELDTSEATLLIIRADAVYILRDGFDEQELVTERKRRYWLAQQTWEREVRMILDLKKLERDRIKAVSYLGEHHPDIRMLDTEIKNTMYTRDAMLREMVPERTRMEGRLSIIGREYGTDSNEYANLKAGLDQLITAIKIREERIRTYVRNDIMKSDGDTGDTTETPLETSTGVNGDGGAGDLELQQRPPAFKDMVFHPNRVDGTPDRILIGNPVRRTVSIERTDSGDENYVNQNYTEFYKRIRDRHILRFATQFKELVIAPDKYNATVIVNKTVLGSANDDQTHSDGTITNEVDAESVTSTEGSVSGNDLQLKFNLRVRVVANDGTEYTAIDSDGDGVTETFLVREPGEFNWGQPEMPNVISIFNNQNADVREIIKDLARIAVYGDPGEAQEFASSREELMKNVENFIEGEEAVSRHVVDEQNVKRIHRTELDLQPSGSTSQLNPDQ